MGFPGSSAAKESSCNAGDPGSVPGLGRFPGEGTGYALQYSWASLLAQTVRIHLRGKRPGFNPWAGKTPWRRTWQPTPVFLPGTEEPAGPQSMESKSWTRLSSQAHTDTSSFSLLLQEYILKINYIFF